MSITGERLKKLRQKQGLTQEELADILNVKTSTVSGYESGYRSLDIEKLIIISSHFDVPADYLLGISDTEKRVNVEINIDLGLEDKPIEVLKKFRNSAISDHELSFHHQQYLKTINLFLSDDDLKFFGSVFDYALARYSIDFEKLPDKYKEKFEQDAKLYEWIMIKNLNEYVSKLSESLANERILYNIEKQAYYRSKKKIDAEQQEKQSTDE